MSILTYPSGTLLDKANPVSFPATEETKALIEEMTAEMADCAGVGIGATQVSSALRIFIIDKQFAGTTEHLVFINPEITEKSQEMDVQEEGCLSLPGVTIKVKRHLGVTCKAYDIEGKEFTVEAKDFYARAIQHEVDHLNGKLIIHYLGSAQRSMVMNKMKNFLRDARRKARALEKHSHEVR